MLLSSVEGMLDVKLLTVRAIKQDERPFEYYPVKKADRMSIH